MTLRDLQALPAKLTNPSMVNIFNKSTNFMCLDFEVTNLDKGDPCNLDNRIVLTSWYYNGKTYDYNGNEFELYRNTDFPKHLKSCDFIVAHNAKFELGWLKRCGEVLQELPPIYCTLQAQYVLNGFVSGNLDLNSVYSTYYPTSSGKEHLCSLMIKGGVCPSEIPLSLLRPYCRKDVELTVRLFRKQMPLVYAKGVNKVVYTRSQFLAMLADIEFNGMVLDYDRVTKLFVEKTNERDALDLRLKQITGGINLNSTTQLSKFLYDELGLPEICNKKGEPLRTSSGKRATDKTTIGLLKPRTKEHGEFLDLYRKRAKVDDQITKYLGKFYRAVCDDEGFISASFNPSVTRTGRLSSTGKKYSTQFQNLDRGFKPLFRARNSDARIHETDYKQLEFRVAVFYGQDAQGFKDVESGFDVHSYTAEIIGVSRQDAKAHTFKPLYGGTSGTTKEREYYKAFAKKYPDITRTQDGWVTYALLNKGTLRVPTGLIFQFGKLEPQKSGYIKGSTNVKNYPVQYLATAEIVPLGCLFLWHYLHLHKMRSFIINTVHDSVISELFDDEKELYEVLVVKALVDDVYKYLENFYGIDFNVKLEVETKASKFWGDKE